MVFCPKRPAKPLNSGFFMGHFWFEKWAKDRKKWAKDHFARLDLTIFSQKVSHSPEKMSHRPLFRKFLTYALCFTIETCLPPRERFPEEIFQKEFPFHTFTLPTNH